MAISLTELIKSKRWDSLPKETQDNLMILLERINKVRTAYAKTMIVTSGLRTKEDQIRIYKEKGITDLNKIPMGSRHLIGAAVDISDPKQELQSWCLKNEKLLESIGLWCEHFDYTKKPNPWVHFQIFPSKSGHRFFIP